MHNSLSFDKKFQQNTSSFPRILWALVHFVKPGERRRRIQCQPIVLHGRQKIKNFWAKYKVETTKGIFSNASSHLFQDPLYHALVALGLGHKIQINVMASLEMKEVKAAFMDSFYSACKGQPSKGWDKYIFISSFNEYNIWATLSSQVHCDSWGFPASCIRDKRQR